MAEAKISYKTKDGVRSGEFSLGNLSVLFRCLSEEAIMVEKVEIKETCIAKAHLGPIRLFFAILEHSIVLCDMRMPNALELLGNSMGFSSFNGSDLELLKEKFGIMPDIQIIAKKRPDGEVPKRPFVCA